MKKGVKQNIKLNSSYYLTMTIIGWVDVFSRKEHRDIILDTFRYCIKNKGLAIYAYCIMTNHLHMIANCDEPFQLKDTIRDFKKHTAKQLISLIKNGNESRKEWMLKVFEEAGRSSTKNKDYKIWQSGNHAIELFSPIFTWDKVNYIHQNPVRAKLVNNGEDWIYSSASNYSDQESVLLNEVVCLTPRLITYS
jgi:REP element-mobilizing transposase RayT